MPSTVAKDRKQEIVEKFGRHDRDTGSPGVQIALLTERIEELTEHMQDHQKDYSSRRGLLKLVAKRKDLLKYLKDKDRERYLHILNELDIRGV
jgi:small subunit ribosomal protein S15